MRLINKSRGKEKYERKYDIGPLEKGKYPRHDIRKELDSIPDINDKLKYLENRKRMLTIWLTEVSSLPYVNINEISPEHPDKNKVINELEYIEKELQHFKALQDIDLFKNKKEVPIVWKYIGMGITIISFIILLLKNFFL